MNKKTALNWDEIFIGRKEIVKKLLNARRDCFILGARRIGKTTLLKYLENKYLENSIPAFYISIQGYLDSEKITRKIENALRFKREQFKLPDVQAQNTSLFEFIEELDAKSQTTKIVFLIDEAEQICKIDEKEPGFIDKFRNLVETLDNVVFMLAASPHIKKLVARSACSAFLSAFDNEILPVMTKKEITELIYAIAPGITNDEIAGILHFTHHQPYLVRIFLNKLIRNSKIQMPSQNLAQDTYIANSLDGIFPNYFDGLMSEDQKIVRGIHEGTFQAGAQDALKLRELAQYGYLKHTNSGYRISNWFFEQWLSGEDFSDEKDHSTVPLEPAVSKFKEIAEYFKEAANKLVVKIVLIILAVLAALLLGKKFKLLDKLLEWLF